MRDASGGSGAGLRCRPTSQNREWGTQSECVWLGDDGDALDLDQRAFGKGGYLDGGAGGSDRAFGGEGFGVERVHRCEVGHVLEEDGGLYDVGEVKTGGGQDGFEILEDAGGLGLNSTGNEFACGRVEGNLAGGVQDVTDTDGLGIRSDGGWCVSGSDGGPGGREKRHTEDCRRKGRRGARVLWFCADNSNGEEVLLAIAGAMVL